MNPVIQKLHEAQLPQRISPSSAPATPSSARTPDEGEGEKVKERIQTFEGVVISKKGRASSASFTVRRVSFGVASSASSRCIRLDCFDRRRRQGQRPPFAPLLPAQSARQGSPHQARSTRRKLQRPPSLPRLKHNNKEFAKGQATACPFFLLGC